MKPFLQRSFALLVGLGLSLQLVAQDRAIAGKIANAADNSPMPGVSVVLKGTTRGTTTDADGSYKINAATGQTLIFSYIGYVRREGIIGNQSVLNLEMESDENTLNEVIVTSLNISQDKRALNYAAQQVKGSEILNAQRDNFMLGLQGHLQTRHTTLDRKSVV